ncbi:hypothetical protein ACQEV9_45140 [Streptomyces chartreusis]|uniref:hypothetical protein n=1 Tax=Streptomyces chartreusis TaxID=1969 RepID=UPI003D8DE72E
MPAYASPAQLAELATNPATATFRPKRATVLSYGLGADSTAILLMYLADPTAHGLEPDLSDLIVVHAVTGDEWARPHTQDTCPGCAARARTAAWCSPGTPSSR